MSTKGAGENWILDPGLSLARATHDGISRQYFEITVVDGARLGHIGAAPHKAIFLANEKRIILGAIRLGRTLVDVKNFMRGDQARKHHCTDDGARHCISSHVHQFGLSFSR